MSILAWRLTGPLPERTGERLFAREPNRQRNLLYRLTGTAQLFDGPVASHGVPQRLQRRPLFFQLTMKGADRDIQSVCECGSSVLLARTGSHQHTCAVGQ